MKKADAGHIGFLQLSVNIKFHVNIFERDNSVLKKEIDISIIPQ